LIRKCDTNPGGLLEGIVLLIEIKQGPGGIIERKGKAGSFNVYKKVGGEEAGESKY